MMRSASWQAVWVTVVALRVLESPLVHAYGAAVLTQASHPA